MDADQWPRIIEMLDAYPDTRPDPECKFQRIVSGYTVVEESVTCTGGTL